MTAQADRRAESPDPLFTPYTLGPCALRNRLVMAPMTRNRAGPGGVPKAMNARYYAQRAGAGLIITEAAQVSGQGVGYPGTPGLHTGEQVEGWRTVVAAVHAAGGSIFAQLFHCGRISHPSLQPGGATPVAPSALRPAGETVTPEGPRPFVTPRALGLEEIPGVVEQFRHAARLAREAGFDGVEIHAANGYLLDQFLRDGTNRRRDRYGGSHENRVRLLLEVTAAVIEVWDPHRVGVRLSPINPFNDIRDTDPQATFEYAARALAEAHAGYLHVVEQGEGSFEFARLRARFTGPYIANGGYDAERARAAVRSGYADLVSFGVAFLANPDLPGRLARGAPLNAPDPATFYGGDERGYLDYPRLEADRR